PSGVTIPIALTSYVGCSGRGDLPRSGVLTHELQNTFRSITDGTSFTLLLGERPPPPTYRLGHWYAGSGVGSYGEAGVILSTGNLVHSNFRFPFRDTPPTGPLPFTAGSIENEWDAFHFWSLHPGGANFAFADGSVRFLTYNADSVMPALATRAGGETVTIPD
ncbi:MAG: DUF1559 domain-containing protein, partial [Gemmataceae bacterium]